MYAWDALLSWCRCELSKEERRAEWEEVRRRRSELAALTSPAEVLELLDRRTSGPPTAALFEQRDRVLLALLEEHLAGHAALTRPLLLLAFAPALTALHGRFPGAAAGGDLLNLVLESFLGVVASYPIERRRSKVALNLARDTEKRLCRSLELDRRREDAEREAAEAAAGHREEWEQRPSLDLADELRPSRFEGPSPDDVDDALQALDMLVERDVISELERHLIAAANVRGLELKAWVGTEPAELGGMRYEAAKKRLQRALVKVRTYLKTRRLRLSDLLVGGDW
ncbi:MAG: hypothetical protein HY901_23885 [Deltaproteobacteria bacterium]|nr:hypothetical protein [Deltaproteobacteria bacterium]